VRLRRKAADPTVDDAVDETTEAGEAGETTDAAVTAGERTAGPFDADDLPDDGIARLDLGSLLVAPTEDRELRVQVDEQSGAVRAVLLATDAGALELRAFAAPRNGDLWSAPPTPPAAAAPPPSARAGSAPSSCARCG